MQQEILAFTQLICTLRFPEFGPKISIYSHTSKLVNDRDRKIFTNFEFHQLRNNQVSSFVHQGTVVQNQIILFIKIFLAYFGLTSVQSLKWVRMIAFFSLFHPKNFNKKSPKNIGDRAIKLENLNYLFLLLSADQNFTLST